MTIKTLPQLEIELNLPDYTDDLAKAAEAAQGILIKLNELKKNDALDDYWHDKLYEDNSRVLNFVASLSQSVFNIENKLETIYTRKYISDPIKAKHTWYRHYEQLHQPFTIVKNRCWRIYEMLDSEYFRLFPTMFPPNWDKRLYVDNVQSDDDIDPNEKIYIIDDEYTQDYSICSVIVQPEINTMNKQFNNPYNESYNNSTDQLLADKLSKIIGFVVE